MSNVSMYEIKNVTVYVAETSHKENDKGNNYLPFRQLQPIQLTCNLVNQIKFSVPDARQC